MAQVTEQVRTDLEPCPFATAEQEWYCENTEPVEIEQDGDHEMFECPECGSTWGFRLITGVSIAGDCQAGVPETIRRKAAGERMQPIPLGMTIGIGPPQ